MSSEKYDFLVDIITEAQRQAMGDAGQPMMMPEALQDAWSGPAQAPLGASTPDAAPLLTASATGLGPSGSQWVPHGSWRVLPQGYLPGGVPHIHIAPICIYSPHIFAGPLTQGVLDHQQFSIPLPHNQSPTFFTTTSSSSYSTRKLKVKHLKVKPIDLNHVRPSPGPP